MLKRLSMAGCLVLCLSSPALSQQQDSRSAGAEGQQTHSNQAATFNNNGQDINFAPVIHQDTVGKNGGHADLVGEAWSDTTNTQGAGAPNGPNLIGTSSYNARRVSGAGESGAPTSAPFAGSYIAPGNFALRQLRLRALPATRFDSRVHASGYSESMFGDEGTNGPPPLTNFSVMDSTWDGNMTTGHPSDAPSAWNTPQ